VSIEVLTEGRGASPVADDYVIVHYVIKTMAGPLFPLRPLFALFACASRAPTSLLPFLPCGLHY
jgi:hypothetical protein